ncbi:MAG TPA: hypothetical protein VME23_05335 [Terracidiphilus sp.]|nr:hypothetical protein [Terracidiphilus sp.]
MLENVTEEVGTVMLTLASALLFEELTLGALVRLLITPRTRTRCEGQSKRQRKNARPPE